MKLKSLGSRTLAIVTFGDSLYDASIKINKELSKISGNFYYRKDIGAQQIKYKDTGIAEKNMGVDMIVFVAKEYKDEILRMSNNYFKVGRK